MGTIDADRLDEGAAVGEGLRIVVVGAGTGVGKTHVATALAAELVRRGVPLTARKPVESGYAESGSDAERLARSAGHPTLRPLYALREPVSPHRAARNEGITVALEPILAWCSGDRATLVETAGGLLSPLSPAITNLDLTRALGPTAVVLVAADRLGVLHEVRACLHLLGEHGMVPRVVLSRPEVADASTEHNAAELAALGWVRDATVFPRAAEASPETRAAAVTLADRLLA